MYNIYIGSIGDLIKIGLSKMNENQLSIELSTTEEPQQYRTVKNLYSVDISHIYRFYISVNWHGRLDKCKTRNKDSDVIFECDNEAIADEILNCIESAKKRGVYVVPKFNPIPVTGIDKVAVNQWKSSVERKLGYEKSQFYRSVPSQWDF